MGWTVAAGKRKCRLKTNARHLLTCIWSVSIDVEAKVEEELRVVEGNLQLLAVLPKNKTKAFVSFNGGTRITLSPEGRRRRLTSER